MGKYYYHGLNHGVVYYNFWSILKDGEIKSRRKRGCGNAYGTNGFDFVSVCKKEDSSSYLKHINGAFYKYIYNHLCFVISDKIEAIKPTVLEKTDDIELDVQRDPSDDERYSDMFDEWQVKDEISLSNVVAIGVPMSNIKKDGYTIGLNYKEYLEFIDELKTVTKAMNIDLLDSANPSFADEFEAKNNEVCYNKKEAI